MKKVRTLISKDAATVLAAGIICGAMEWQTRGDSGIGWFVLILLIFCT